MNPNLSDQQADAPAASYKYNLAGVRIEKVVSGSPDLTLKYCYDRDRDLLKSINDICTELEDEREKLKKQKDWELKYLTVLHSNISA